MIRAAKPELVSWQDVNPKRFVLIDFNQTYRQQLSHASLNFWSHLDFLQLIVELSDS
jgi:hypothetical protein